MCFACKKENKTRENCSWNGMEFEIFCEDKFWFPEILMMMMVDGKKRFRLYVKSLASGECTTFTP